MSTHPVSGLGPAAPQPTVGGQTPQFAPPLEEKNASRVRLIEAIRKVGIRPFNDFCCAHSQARIVQARCGWSALNGRIPTFRCGWWQKQTGVFFPSAASRRVRWVGPLRSILTKCLPTSRCAEPPKFQRYDLQFVASPKENDQTLPNRNLGNPRIFNVTICSLWFSHWKIDKHGQIVTLGTPEISTLRFAFCGFPKGKLPKTAKS